MEIKFMYENIIIREEEKVVKERKVDLYHYDYEQKPLLIDMATNGLVLSYNIIQYNKALKHSICLFNLENFGMPVY
jgi:hypothetical protein